MRNRKAVISLVIVLLAVTFTVGCQKNLVTAHPNQINTFDGQTYDTLVTAQAALDEAKSQFAQGKLPAGSKIVINAGGAAYEAARSSWATWRDISLGVKAGDVNAAQLQLNSDMLAMATAIAKVVALTGGGR
jgi:predicted lipoprotein